VRKLLIVLAAAPLLLAACGGDESGGDDPADSADPTSISGVAVAGDFGATPEVEVDSPVTVEETTVETLSEGEGDTVAAGDTVVVDYVGLLGSTGAQFDSSYERGQPAVFATDAVLPGIAKAIEGKTVGSRVVAAVAPEDGYGPQGGLPDAGIEEDETLVFVLDIVAAPELEESGISGVRLGEYDDQPLLVVDAPLSISKTQVEVLSPGEGPTVEPGAEVTVNYVGVNGGTGATFDSSYQSGQPATFTTTGVVPGFAKALEGQPVGARVVVAMTPEDGYGAAGNPQAGIGPSDPLVFVIDILETRAAPEPTEPPETNDSPKTKDPKQPSGGGKGNGKG